MSYGIKIMPNPSVMFATTKPYIAGAKIQLERYLEAQRIMKTHKIVLGGGIDKCMYELSSLLEHLDTIEAQLRNCDIKLSTGEKIRQFRNHLRHDARGEEDFSKGKRGQAIGLSDKLLVHIEFTDSGVKMGSSELSAQQIDTYITTAETIMWAITMGGKIEIDGETVTIPQYEAEITIKDDPMSKATKEKKLTIVINKTVSEVFDFTVNPDNTPKWIDGIVLEETNETPPKLGTIYRNKGESGNWNEYEMTAIVKDKMYELSRINGNYHVRYTFTPTAEGQCDFEYYEWVDEGELDDTFTQEVLEKLKRVINQ